MTGKFKTITTVWKSLYVATGDGKEETFEEYDISSFSPLVTVCVSLPNWASWMESLRQYVDVGFESLNSHGF